MIIFLCNNNNNSDWSTDSYNFTGHSQLRSRRKSINAGRGRSVWSCRWWDFVESHRMVVLNFTTTHHSSVSSSQSSSSWKYLPILTVWQRCNVFYHAVQCYGQTVLFFYMSCSPWYILHANTSCNWVCARKVGTLSSVPLTLLVRWLYQGILPRVVSLEIYSNRSRNLLNNFFHFVCCLIIII